MPATLHPSLCLWALLRPGARGCLGTGSCRSWGDTPATVDFSRDILPILSDNCFLCHGPDAKTRKANLRLDTREGALCHEDPVIVPGQSAESELFLRIISGDEAEVMPPPRSKRTLTPAQVAL